MYVYVVTCEDIDGLVKVSSTCYHDIKNAVHFIETRSDNAKRVNEKNPLLWIGEKHIYKINILTFKDKRSDT